MKRNEFVRSACSLGMCSCAGLSLISPAVLLAGTDEVVKKESDWRLSFIQRRFARMLESINANVDGQTRGKILESVGRACAKENSESYLKFKDDPDGYLEEMKKSWIEKVEFDKSAKTIRINGKKQEFCFCPFIDKSITPKEFCDCSIGYMKESYEAILGNPVEIKLEESILRGGGRCVFFIKY
jgi:hypothetical protein